MRIKILLLSVFFAAHLLARQPAHVLHLRTNYLTDPVGIGATTPLLSWEILSEERETLQTAYQIRAAYSEKDLLSNKHLVWDTKKRISDQSVQVKYEGVERQSRQRIWWQVKIWNQNEKASDWSRPAYFETGFLDPSDWKAAWISPDIEEDTTVSSPCPLLRKSFHLNKKMKEARIYISSQGLYQANINGQKIGEDLFTPGWTTYRKRIQYQVYDISRLLKNGENAIGVILADGWFRGVLKWQPFQVRNFYGNRLALIAQIEITYADGSAETILSDETWKSTTGAIRESDIYNGEIFDARLNKSGWDNTGYDDSDWSGVEVQNTGKSLLVASESQAIRIIKEIKPIAKIITPKGETVFDMGQNMTGWLQFKLKGKTGEKLTLNFAEVLDKDGNFYTENLRAANCQDEYIFGSNDEEIYEPHFTFHGFRYVRLSAYSGEISLSDLTGKVICSDLPSTGDFVCSDTLLNQLQHNIQWSLWGNMLDIPSDCPQRDERLGWTGDAQIITPTACFNVDAAAFYNKWMKDFALDQRADGNAPNVVPDLNNDYGSSAWADAGIIIPWTVYKAYGDKNILQTQYASMQAWVEFIRKDAEKHDYICTFGHHYGDWLAFSTNRSDYPGATTDKDFIATAYFAYSVDLLGKIAEIIGKPEDAQSYNRLFDKLKAAFQREYMSTNGRLSSNTQTAYVLALAFRLIPKELEVIAAKRLADDVRKFGHPTTGFLGTPLICDALTQYGYTDLAYLLLFRKTCPSWLYPVTKGATTIWERWDGIKPDGSFQDKNMNSFNHYAYGAIGNWLYTQVAGIRQSDESCGYKKIIIQPQITDQLTFAQAKIHSVYGEIKSRWERKEEVVYMEIDIPANTSARIYFPIPDENNGKENKFIETGSGSYRFEVNLQKNKYTEI